jgi:CheY-like chemotaxis protein
MSRLALVVDDSMLVRYSVRRFLEDRGYAVETAWDGVDGLAVLDRITPCLIVTDLMMPKMSGVEFIREVRARAPLAHIPIIMVAGRRGSHERVPTCGADYVVYKDIDLVEQLQRTLDKFGPNRVIPPNTEAAAG